MSVAAAQGTLWLHIGTHKTGTTSIQRALQMRRAQLERRDIALHPAENAFLWADRFTRAGVMTSPRMQGALTPPTLDDLQAFPGEVARIRGPRRDLVVSSENFIFQRDALEAFAMRTLLMAGFARLVVIVAFRRMADWRASRKDQLIKTRLWDRQKALPDQSCVDGAWYYDPPAIRAYWSRMGELREIDYDAAVAADGSILPAFARALDIPDLFDGIDLRLNSRTLRP